MKSPGMKAYEMYQEALSFYQVDSDSWSDLSDEDRAVWEKFAEKVWA